MKQVININFQGRVVPIEVTAFDMLKNYTESLGRYFAAEEGKDEIINDIENRIGELFQERLKSGAICITEEDVAAIIRNMGRPEDFDSVEPGTAAGEAPKAETEHVSVNIRGKRLYRSEAEKLIGGVCSGLANYFGIDVVIVRIIFILLFFAGGTGFIAYLILWVAVPSTASTEIGSTRKKLYRDTDDKIIAGVCSGIGNYFGINPWIPRVLFLLPFLTIWNDWGEVFSFGFSPGSVFVYIILWLVIPEAKTTAEKLEMKGEKVDLNSIKNSVMEEIKGVQQRAGKFSKEAGAMAAEKGKAMGAEAGAAARRGGRSLGDIIALLFKIFAYFIVGCVVFAIVVALFAIGMAAIGLFPMKDFILTDGWQNAYAWGTLIFFIAVPIIGIIAWLIRRIARIKKGSRMLGLSFSAMWIIGWVSVILLMASVSKDFRTGNTLIEEEVALTNPAVSKIEITSVSPNNKFYRGRWFSMEPFEDLDEDTAFVRNTEVRIVKSPNDSFRVTMVKLVNGRNRRAADTLAGLMQFNVMQQDSLLLIDKGIPITKKDKFRNQRIILTVYVPVGKQIRIDESVGWPHNIRFSGPWDDGWEVNFDAEIEHGWDMDTDYIMKEEGLYTLDGQPADRWKHRDDQDTRIHVSPGGVDIRSNDGYRYDSPMTTDTVTVQPQNEQQRIKDSLKKEKEKIERQLEGIDRPVALLGNPLALLY